jgi:hypothetical protein
MKKNFVMRGQTPSGETEILNFGGYKPGYAYRLVEFEIYPSTNVGGAHYELAATLTAAKVEEDPANPDFTNEGLIGTVLLVSQSGIEFYGGTRVINDTFLITQDLILSVIDTVAGSPMAVNWQCRFEAVKMSGPEEAATNFKQFTIFDG